MASLPHQLDGPPPTKRDLPAYIERVDALQELYIEENNARARAEEAHQEAVRLAIRYLDEMDRYRDALIALKELGNDHLPIIRNPRAVTIIDRALRPDW